MLVPAYHSICTPIQTVLVNCCKVNETGQPFWLSGLSNLKNLDTLSADWLLEYLFLILDGPLPPRIPITASPPRELALVITNQRVVVIAEVLSLKISMIFGLLTPPATNGPRNGEI